MAAQLAGDAGVEPVIEGGHSTAKGFDPDTPFHGEALSTRNVRAAWNVKAAPNSR
jgi:hypothetical protein